MLQFSSIYLKQIVPTELIVAPKLADNQMAVLPEAYQDRFFKLADGSDMIQPQKVSISEDGLKLNVWGLSAKAKQIIKKSEKICEEHFQKTGIRLFAHINPFVNMFFDVSEKGIIAALDSVDRNAFDTFEPAKPIKSTKP